MGNWIYGKQKHKQWEIALIAFMLWERKSEVKLHQYLIQIV